MTSLRFIEKEIEKEQGIIKTYKECFKIDKTEFDKQITRGYIQIHQKNIEHLQQIKAELEAWEVVKKHLEYFPSDFSNGIPKEVITMTSQIDKKDYPVIKKALEVEDES